MDLINEKIVLFDNNWHIIKYFDNIKEAVQEANWRQSFITIINGQKGIYIKN